MTKNNPIRVIDLTAKENALEDCMVAMKKGFEKDEIELKDMLQEVRKLSGRQFMCLVKRDKLMKVVTG